MMLRSLLVSFSLCLCASQAIAEPPAAAAAVGYTKNTFSSSFNSDIDLANTHAGNRNWYVSKWFGWPATKPDKLPVSSEGVTLSDGGDTANYTIGSATEDMHKPPYNYVGKAFGGGGYFEAVLKIDVAKVKAPKAVGFPAWWLEPVEHLATPRNDQWPGQISDYEHFVEVDIFEYNQWDKVGNDLYSGAVHDWYGKYRETCQPQFCHSGNNGHNNDLKNYLVYVPPHTDFGEFHRFGVLWVPATDTTQGYLQYYYDGVATDTRVTWDKYHGKEQPAGNMPWTFGVVDQQHLVLILGTGNNQPMTVKSVNVWQASDAQNIKR